MFRRGATNNKFVQEIKANISNGYIFRKNLIQARGQLGNYIFFGLVVRAWFCYRFESLFGIQRFKPG